MRNSNRARKKRQWCICHPEITMANDEAVQGYCSQGCCVEFRCPRCEANVGGWGPVGCRCQGYIRWMRYPGMASSRYPEAIKPSLPHHRRHKGYVVS